MESAESDVLALLDCCYAASAHKGATEERRTYELLAACHKDQITRGPGPNSFTTRLLEALEKLLDDPKKPAIIMTRLQQMINNNRDVPNINPAMLLDRLDNHVGSHIQLAPVQQRAKEKNEEFQSRPSEEAVVKLRFSLEAEELTQDQIERWAQELSKLRQNTGIPIRQIDWIKVDKKQSLQRLRDAVEVVRARNNKRKSPTGVSPADDESLSARKRSREELSIAEDMPDLGPLTPASGA